MSIQNILSPPEGADEDVWKYEHLRQFCQELNGLATRLQVECTPQRKGKIFIDILKSTLIYFLKAYRQEIQLKSCNFDLNRNWWSWVTPRLRFLKSWRLEQDFVGTVGKIGPKILTRKSCPQMTATDQWIFLCAAHKSPKECSAIDYTR